MKIPELLTTISGEKITTKEDWEIYRRPEIMNLFSEYVYGVRPVERPDGIEFKTERVDETAFGVDIERERVTISFPGYSFKTLGFMPKKKEKVPVFVHVMHEFQEGKCDLEKSFECIHVDFEEIFKRGYGVYIMYTSGICPDCRHQAKFKKGIYPVYEKDAENRADNAWATISAWAWGVSRVIDYLETKENVDMENIYVTGHSRGGKTALWCGATDKRVKCAISNNSGCTGAAMNRGKIPEGEPIKYITEATDWFCKNYKKFSEKEDMLPIDQHMLIAAMAPRYVYVASASADDWADPAAERMSCRLAEDAYKLYGMTGVILPDEKDLKLDTPYHEGNIGYHVKTGDHGLEHSDWKLFLDFLDEKRNYQ